MLELIPHGFVWSAPRLLVAESLSLCGASGSSMPARLLHSPDESVTPASDCRFRPSSEGLIIAPSPIPIRAGPIRRVEKGERDLARGSVELVMICSYLDRCFYLPTAGRLVIRPQISEHANKIRYKGDLGVPTHSVRLHWWTAGAPVWLLPQICEGPSRVRFVSEARRSGSRVEMRGRSI